MFPGQGCCSSARSASSVQVSGGLPGAGLGASSGSNSLMSSGRSRSAGRVTERAARVSRRRWRQGPGGVPGVYVTTRDASGRSSSRELRAATSAWASRSAWRSRRGRRGAPPDVVGPRSRHARRPGRFGVGRVHDQADPDPRALSATPLPGRSFRCRVPRSGAGAPAERASSAAFAVAWRHGTERPVSATRGCCGVRSHRLVGGRLDHGDHPMTAPPWRTGVTCAVPVPSGSSRS